MVKENGRQRVHGVGEDLVWTKKGKGTRLTSVIVESANKHVRPLVQVKKSGQGEMK